RIKELEKEYGFLDPAVCLKISEEIAKEKFCKFKSHEEAMDAGLRVAFGYLTCGVVAAPLEGYTHFKVKKTRDGKDYISPFFSGPIGGAGRTAASIFLLITDYIRELMGYAKYDPTEQEVKRMITEVYDRHERVNNLQYLPSPAEIDFLVRNLPIQIDGDPTEEREVSNYKDLDRIETNRIRSGACLILGEGIAQKAPKLLRTLNKLRKIGFKFKDWDWLEKFVELQKSKIEEKKQSATATYIQDVVAGRPVFGHPSASGAFRLRYGRCRLSGYSAMAIHPATMTAFDGFIAFGTQIKLEKPSKAAAIGVCDSIDGPIVKLLDGSVVQFRTVEKAKELKDKIKEIIYSGDILVSYGDFINRNHLLNPCGYNNEWWLAELKEVAVKYSDPQTLAIKTEAQLEDMQKVLQTLDKKAPSLEEAMKVSIVFNMPLHPDFIYYWSQIKFSQFIDLLEWISRAEPANGNLNLPYGSHERERLVPAKRALELTGMEHKVGIADVIIEKKDADAMAANFGISPENFESEIKAFFEKAKIAGEKTVLEFINENSRFRIKDKAGTFIGSRMGRPEKAKPRELTGSPNCLFPVGEEGGRLRSLQAANEKGYVESDWPIHWCEKCGSESIYFVCHKCGGKTQQMHYCSKCFKKMETESCPLHGQESMRPFSEQKIPIKEYYDCAIKQLGLKEKPVLVKGVRGTSSTKHIPENLAKGILRASFSLHVNKDGTIRYDASEVPITQFKPKEVGTSIEKLRELGYTKDIFDRELKNEEQILEMKPHDIILPSYGGNDEAATDTFFKTAKFIDALLEKFYKQKPFYNLQKKEDLAGHLLLCIAPHNCAGVVARIIGHAPMQAFLASPFMHATMRRDCDGDEGAMMLLLDALLNFSREYLPAHRGSTQDAPLTLNTRIRPAEIDDMIFDLDVAKEYPLEMYMAAEKNMPPNTVKIEQISDRLKSDSEFASLKNLHYTHDVSDINAGTGCSIYKTLATMQEKLDHQMALAEKLRAVDEADVARLVIDRHFIRDIKGNFHKFTKQQFRCVGCNEKYRRPPLKGKCLKCGGRLIFTIAEGSIIKYLESARKLAEKFNVPAYTKQNIALITVAIESVFGREKEKQQDLKKFF
ncbi:MAG: DNA polymerase II large subunit, partial [Candidatus Micrarchaeia archaeon]